jgi:hypothetical protein
VPDPQPIASFALVASERGSMDEVNPHIAERASLA